MTKEEIIKALRDMARYPTVTLPRDSEALKVAADLLAQPEQEPVAFINVEQRKLEWAKYMTWDTPTVVNLPKIPLYTTPPQRKPLTDKQILADETLRYYFGQNGGAGPVSKQGRKVVDAIETAHGIKENT